MTVKTWIDLGDKILKSKETKKVFKSLKDDFVKQDKKLEKTIKLPKISK